MGKDALLLATSRDQLPQRWLLLFIHQADCWKGISWLIFDSSAAVPVRNIRTMMIQCIRFNGCKHCLRFFMGGYNGVNPDIVREGHGGSLNNL